MSAKLVQFAVAPNDDLVADGGLLDASAFGPPPCRPLPPTEHGGGTAGETAFLELLGERVRLGRTRQGMSRKMLARLSGVSERHLAQLETGHGNVSVLLLRRIAQAVNLRPVDLLREEAAAAVDWAPNRIVLAGMKGAGKTALGWRLAEALDAPLAIIERDVALAAQMPAATLLGLGGAAAYRRLERLCLERTLRRLERVVIVLGGICPPEADDVAALRGVCATVAVHASAEELVRRAQARGACLAGPPQLDVSADFVRRSAERAALHAAADAVIDTTGRSLETSFAELTAALTALRLRQGPSTASASPSA